MNKKRIILALVLSFAVTLGFAQNSNDMLNVFRPDAVESVHRAYIDAGADIIETNTFNATSISLTPYGAQQWGYQINLVGARIARSAADWEEHTEDDVKGGILRIRKPRSRKVWVAGSMIPETSVCGMVIAHPSAKYFTIEKPSL